MNVKILADSACDLPKHYYNDLQIEKIALTVHLDGEEFEDSVTITPKTIYDALRAGKRIKTSQATPQAFKSIFLSCATSNVPLIYFALSSTLSGTYESAKIMEKEIKEEYPDAPLHVIDTSCVSLGYGLVVLRAAQLANTGASVEEIIEIGTYHGRHMEHIFTVDNLEYLYRSGRLRKSQALIGTLLNIKPILNVVNGKLVPLEKIRGSKKVINRIMKIAEERGVDFRNQVIGISHGDVLKTAQNVAKMIKEHLGAKEIIIDMVGSAVGTHAGPGTIAVFFLNKPYK